MEDDVDNKLDPDELQTIAEDEMGQVNHCGLFWCLRLSLCVVVVAFTAYL